MVNKSYLNPSVHFLWTIRIKIVNFEVKLFFPTYLEDTELSFSKETSPKKES